MPQLAKSPEKSTADEVAALRQALLESEEKRAAQRRRHEAQLAVKDEHIVHLNERIRALLIQRFGCKADQIPNSQLGLFNEAEATVHEAADEPSNETIAVPAHTRQRKGRRPLPESLPRVEVIHDLDDADKVCPHDGTPLNAIGADTSEQLDIIPAQVRVLKHIRKKYACPCCESHVVTAKKPAQLIEKSNASAGFLAWMIQGKYQLAMPLHRQSQYLSALGLDIGRHTLAQWAIRCGDAATPLIDRLRQQLNAGAVQHIDETTLQVLKEDGRSPQSKSFLWVQKGGPPDTPIVLFHYDASRGQTVLDDLVSRDFQGAIQSDGYAAYDRFVSQRAASGQAVVHLGCLAHARRKFVEAAKVQKKKTGAAHQAVAWIAKLYAIEARIRDLTASEKAQIRQAQAQPILKQMRQWLDKQRGRITPSSLTGKALSYMDSQWPKLIRYIDNGHYAIDNNPVERAIRPFTVGRKNWLFSASPAGATASANLYSLVETAKANDIEPYAYLRTLFTDLPLAANDGDIDALLPLAQNRDRFQRPI